MTEHKIKVYSTQTCPWCIKAKAWLEENKVEFEYIDVGADPEAAKEMVEKSGQRGVPVIEIDDEIIIGFNEEKIKELLGL
jgi:glutaredoxin-like YruB-family protein|tara:strand:- start:565 stop:804 length:240 start_codon:yes stop_codon:yes gene_type:complete